MASLSSLNSDDKQINDSARRAARLALRQVKKDLSCPDKSKIVSQHIKDLNSRMLNQSLMKYLKPYRKTKKACLLKKIFYDCFVIVEENIPKTMQMMEKIGSHAYVKLDTIDCTKRVLNTNKQDKNHKEDFTDVEKNMEDMFGSDSSGDQLNSAIASGSQSLLNDTAIISLSESSDDELFCNRDDNIIIQKPKIKGFKKSKMVSAVQHPKVSTTVSIKNTQDAIPLPINQQEITQPPEFIEFSIMDITFSNDIEYEDNLLNQSPISTNLETTSNTGSVNKNNEIFNTAKYKPKNCLNKRPSVSNKCNNTIDSEKDTDMNMDVSDLNKKTVLARLFKKKSNMRSSLNAITNSNDLTQNQSTTSKSNFVPPASNENINSAKEIIIEHFKIIIFTNFNLYGRNCMQKIAKTIKTKKLFPEWNERWSSHTLKLVNTLMEDLFKMLKDVKFKDIVFMACLSVSYRRVYSTDKSDDLYINFVKFIELIKKCMEEVNNCFWKPVLPNGWAPSITHGCLIADHIMYGTLPTSMYTNVKWNEIVQEYNYLYVNEQQFPNTFNSASTELVQSAINSPCIPSYSNIPTAVLSNDEDPGNISLVSSTSKTTTVTAHTVELNSINNQLEQLAIKNSLISHTSNITSTVMQHYDKGNIKRVRPKSLISDIEQVKKKMKVSSHSTLQQLHRQSQCLETPKYSVPKH